MTDNEEFRSFPVERDPDGSARGVLATENPVSMFDLNRGEFVPEVLQMSGMAIRNGEDSLTLLNAHNSGDCREVLGSFRGLNVEQRGEYLAVTGKPDISASEDAIKQKVEEGHIREMSVGYKVLKRTFVPEGESRSVNGRSYEGPCNVVTKWQANEASLVPLGADEMAQLKGYKDFESMKRALSPKTADKRKPAGLTPRRDPGKTTGSRKTRATQPIKVNEDDLTPEEIREQLRGEIRAEQDKIREMAEEFGLPKSFTAKAVADGLSFEDAKSEGMRFLAENRSTPTRTMEQAKVTGFDLSTKEARNYDFGAALQDLAEGREVGGLAGELTKEIGKRADRNHVGRLFIPQPHDLSEGARVLLHGTATDGAELVPTITDGSRFVPALRPRPVMQDLGAQVLTGMVGNFDIPRETTTPTPTTWTEAENVAHDEGESQFGTISFRPNAYGFYTDVSDRLIRHGSPALVPLMERIMNREVTIAMDQDGISGAGSGSDEILGIENSTIVTGAVSITTANQPDFDEILELEEDVATANAELGTLAYLTTFAIRKHCKKTPEYGTDRNPLWSRDNEINGYRAVASNQCTAGSMIYGNWNSYMFVVFDPIEVKAVTDKDLSIKRVTRFVVNIDIDGAALSNSFSVGS